MKKYLKKWWIRFLTKIIKLDRLNSFYILKSISFDTIVRRFNEPAQFNWSHYRLFKQPDHFEDLAGLFFCCPLSRGIIRLDIDEAAALYKYVSKLQNPIGVEIGRFYGGSTVLLASAIGQKGKLYSIDINPKNKDIELKDVLTKSELIERVNLIIADANSVEISSELDFVFIDGDHSYEGARLDHNKWGEKIKKGGLIIHHDMGNGRDYSVQWNDLEELYTSILKHQLNYLEVVEEVGSLVIFRKKNEFWKEIPELNGLDNSGHFKNPIKSNSYLDKEVC